MSEQIHHRACHLCEATCGARITVTNGEINSIKGDPDDPLSRGFICPKAVALQDLHNDPDRLRRPVRRVGDDWEEISWEAAFTEVAQKLLESRKQFGDNSFAIYAGNPSVHNYGMMLGSNAALGYLKTRNRYSSTSVDQLPHQLVSYWMYGHQLLVPIPDIDHTDYLLMLGANPLASNGSIMTVPDIKNRISDLQSRGGKLVVLDPRRTETAEVADEHHFIRPGTDVLFLLALLHTLFDEGLVDTGRAKDWLEGWEQIPSLVAGYTPEKVAGTTGVDAGEIRRMARELSGADKAVCYGRMGVSVQVYGTLCQWLIQLINIATGSFDKVGGNLFTAPAMDLIHREGSKPGHFDAWRSRVRGLPEFSSELPAAALAEEMLTPGEGQVRSFMSMAANPVLSTPNGRQLEKALQGLDFMVSVDFYINETTCHADIILPPTSPLEHEHFDHVFFGFAVHNTVRFNQAVFPKPEGCLHDWEIFAGLGEALAAQLGVEAGPVFPPQAMVDFALRSGPYGDNSELGLSVEKLAQYPSGLDLGPLQPSCPQRIFHQNKKVICAPEPLIEDLGRVTELLSSDDKGLRLIGRRHVRCNNSWMHNSYRLVKGKPRCQLLVHPSDAQRLELTDGEGAILSSRVGEVKVELQCSDEMMPGTVSLPHGWGHGRPGTRLTVASEHAGVSANDVTDELYIDTLCGNAAVNGVPVELSKA
ncbi:MAG: molybdopterin-dependent oxidoreductase [Halieaceae bacterium]|jgi:anaerobic selenocysteine-containing dehydrogenase|nr:molybdopterin-dependent oxidoreductase [Halieaceae bacterium]